MYDQAHESRRLNASVRRAVLQGVPYLIKDSDRRCRRAHDLWLSRIHGQRGARLMHPLVQAVKICWRSTSWVNRTPPSSGLIGTTESIALGPCRNPWNTDHSTRRFSSGGAAAAVAAGIVPAAQASDGGGSIRIPASCCGLVGLKDQSWSHDGRADGHGTSRKYLFAMPSAARYETMRCCWPRVKPVCGGVGPQRGWFRRHAVGQASAHCFRHPHLTKGTEPDAECARLRRPSGRGAL